MPPQTQPRKRKNSSKVNLTISLVFHSVLVGVMLYFAARQGLAGQKDPENLHPDGERKAAGKTEGAGEAQGGTAFCESPKIEPPKVVEESRPARHQRWPRPWWLRPTGELPGFEFDGGKAVNAESDPVQLYKGYVEYALRAKWNRPDNLDDDTWVAEVRVSVDPAGHLGQPVWQKGSGNAKWDQSVKDVFTVVQSIDRRPPTNFPPQVVIRFDVQQETPDPGITP